MKPIIAVVHELAHVLSFPLECENMTVRQYTNGAAAYDALIECPADLGIFKRNLPGMDGASLFQRLRRTQSMPVIFLTSMGPEYADLCPGADDYLSTGCPHRQLTDSIKLTLRRHYPGRFALSPISDRAPKPLIIDRTNRVCHWRGARVYLNMPEFVILEALARGGVHTRFALMQAIYGPKIEMDQEIVDDHMAGLAHKFCHVDPAARVFECRHGLAFALASGIAAEPWA